MLPVLQLSCHDHHMAIHFCACPKPGPGFSMQCFVGLFYAQWFEVIVRLIEIGGIVDHNCS